MIMLVRLNAEEILNNVTSVSLGMGTMKKYHAAETLSKLRSAAFPRSSRPKSRKATPADLAQLGIRFEVVGEKQEPKDVSDG